MTVNEPKKLRIIVADDDLEMRNYYARILPVLGHDPISFESNAFDLENHASEYKPDLVITDVCMPSLSGLEVVTKIGDKIPCIVVSALDRPDDWNPPNTIQLVAYLVKPVAMDDLEKAIDAAVAMISAVNEQ